jgi:hypothetical protein
MGGRFYLVFAIACIYSVSNVNTEVLIPTTYCDHYRQAPGYMTWVCPLFADQIGLDRVPDDDDSLLDAADNHYHFAVRDIYDQLNFVRLDLTGRNYGLE